MTTTRRGTASLHLAATISALVLAEAVLVRAGAVLPPLPLDRAGILRSFSESDPLALAASVLRLAALAVGTGLLATTLLGIAARACGAVRIVVQVDRWTPPGLRRLLDGALGVGLATSIGFSALPAGADPGGSPGPVSTLHQLPDGPPTTLRRLPDASPAATTERSPPHRPVREPATTLRRLPDAPSPPTPPPPAPGVAPVAPTSGAPAGTREVVVQPGDSFWLLAEGHVAERLGRAPTDVEVGACWQELVAVNRPRLAVPDDPDLLFPGQVLIVPCR